MKKIIILSMLAFFIFVGSALARTVEVEVPVGGSISKIFHNSGMHFNFAGRKCAQILVSRGMQGYVIPICKSEGKIWALIQGKRVTFEYKGDYILRVSIEE